MSFIFANKINNKNCFKRFPNKSFSVRTITYKTVVTYTRIFLNVDSKKQHLNEFAFALWFN